MSLFGGGRRLNVTAALHGAAGRHMPAISANVLNTRLREFARQLRDAGFAIRQRDVIRMFSPEYDPNTLSHGFLALMASIVPAARASPRTKPTPCTRSSPTSAGRASTSSGICSWRRSRAGCDRFGFVVDRDQVFVPRQTPHPDLRP
jgi:hypothetical protein